MNKIILLHLFCLTIMGEFLSPPAFAVPARPDVLELVQPDKAVVKVRVRGDEWNNWIETVRGYSVSKHADGYWKYVDYYDNGIPVLSSTHADREPPPGLERHIRRPFVRPVDGRGGPPAPLSSSPSGAPSASSLPEPAAPAGNFNGPVLFILAEFTDRAGTYTQDSFASFIAVSITDYFNEASHGAVTLYPAGETSGTVNNGVVGWVNLGYAHPDTAGSTGNENKKLIKDAIEAANPYVNYSQYDTDNDGYVDADELAIVVIAAGFEAAYDGGVRSPSVWGHQWSLNTFGPPPRAPTVDGVTVGAYHNGAGGYAQFGEIHQSTAFDAHQATMGIMVHELGHLIFGLPDLYDRDGTSEGIGAFGLMGAGSWGKTNTDAYAGEKPVLPCAWSRYDRGWVTAPEGSGASSLTAAGSVNATDSNTVYRISTGQASEYFLIENRQSEGYDGGLQRWLGGGFGGLAIWHIDESRLDNDSECVSPANCSLTHYMVALEQADGRWDLEEGLNQGNRTDLWYSGNVADFDYFSVPDSDLYNGSRSGVSVTNIGSSGSTMSSTPGLHRYQLTTAVIPAGSGSVTPDCPEGCLFYDSDIITLTAEENSGYFFNSWTNCDAPSGTLCTETMDADDTVTVNFQACPPPVRNARSGGFYDALQPAYDDAEDGDTIQSSAVVFSENLDAYRPIAITLEGGYACNYSTAEGVTTFNGVMTIDSGVVFIGDYTFGN